MANQKTNLTQTVIAFKKISGVANTSMLKTDLAETIGSVVQNSSDRIFGDIIPTTGIPSTMYGIDADQIVQKIEFDLVPVLGSKYAATTADSEAESSTSTTHSFALKLKDTYETDEGGNNPKAGTDPFVDGYHASGSNGTLQLVPPLYNISYSIALQDQNGSPITTGDDMDWYFDYYSGILFRQDGDDTTIPVSGSCYMYIGKYVSDIQSFPYTGSAIISGSLEVTGSFLQSGSFDLISGEGSRIQSNATDLTIEDSLIILKAGNQAQLRHTENPKLYLFSTNGTSPTPGAEVGKIVWYNNASGSVHASIVAKAISDWDESGSATQIVLSAYPSFSNSEELSTGPQPLLTLQSGAVDNDTHLWSYVHTPFSGSKAKFNSLVVDTFELADNLTVNGTLNATQFQIASDEASIDSSGNYIGVGADFDNLKVGYTDQPGFRWYMTNGNIDGFGADDTSGVRLTTYSGSTERAHTGIIVDYSASYVGIIANENQTQDKPHLIVRQVSGGDREVIITGSEFKIIGNDGTQTFSSDVADGALTIGASTEILNLKGSTINFSGSAAFQNDVNVGTLIATTKVTASVIDSATRVSGGQLILPLDDQSYTYGLSFGSDFSTNGRITDDGSQGMIIGYEDTDLIFITNDGVKYDTPVTFSQAIRAQDDVYIDGTLFLNGLFSPQSIIINGGDFEINTSGALYTNQSAQFYDGITSSYFRTTRVGDGDVLKLVSDSLIADGSQSMGIKFDGTRDALTFYGGKIDGYLSTSFQIATHDEYGERTVEIISGSNFVIQNGNGLNDFVYDATNNTFYIGRGGGTGTTTYYDSAQNHLRGSNTMVSSSNLFIYTGSLQDDPINNTTRLLVVDQVTGKVYITSSYGGSDAPTASYVAEAFTDMTLGTGKTVVLTRFNGTQVTRTINNVDDAISASYALTASYSNRASIANLSLSSSGFTYMFNVTNNYEHPVILGFDGTQGYQYIYKDNGNNITYNPGTSTLTVPNVAGTSSWATNAVNVVSASYAGTASRANIASTSSYMFVFSTLNSTQYYPIPALGTLTPNPLDYLALYNSQTNKLLFYDGGGSPGSILLTGSITASSGFLGDLEGTSSWATDAITASYAANASTPTLQEVTTEGNETTDSIIADSFETNNATAGYTAFIGTSSWATSATNIKITTAVSSGERNILLTNGSVTGQADLLVDGGGNITYNALTDTLKVPNVTSTSSWATNAITASYALSAEDTPRIGSNPAANRIGIWEDSETIGADSKLRFNGTYFDINSFQFTVTASTGDVNCGDIKADDISADIISASAVSAGGNVSIGKTGININSLALPAISSNNYVVWAGGKTGQIGYRVGTSRRETKYDINPVSQELVDGINQLQPVTYIYKADEEKRTVGGFIAEEVAEVNPLFAKWGPNYKVNDSGSLDIDNILDDTIIPSDIDDRTILAAAVAKIQQLEKEIQELKAKIT